ncbi:MAG: hypothetical protein NXI04_25870, partial [Planctomycetaceae bacterium]|nr:hypothetical protein [Planctomycetaceae bacterium]
MTQLVYRMLTAAILSICVSSASASLVTFQIRDVAGDPLPCRIHLQNEDKTAVTADGAPFWHDHFVSDGQTRLDLPEGRYTWTIERGPEYCRAEGIMLVDQRESTVEIVLQRLTALREAGWYSGDLHVHRPVADLEALLAAEDLDFAPVIEWWTAAGGGLPPLA